MKVEEFKRLLKLDSNRGKVLRLFFNNPKKEYCSKDLQDILGLPGSSSNAALAKLSKKNLIFRSDVKSMWYYKLNVSNRTVSAYLNGSNVVADKKVVSSAGKRSKVSYDSTSDNLLFGVMTKKCLNLNGLSLYYDDDCLVGVSISDAKSRFSLPSGVLQNLHLLRAE